MSRPVGAQFDKSRTKNSFGDSSCSNYQKLINKSGGERNGTHRGSKLAKGLNKSSLSWKVSVLGKPNTTSAYLFITI